MNPTQEPAVVDESSVPSTEALDAELNELGEALAAAADGDERAELSVAVGVNLLDRYQLGGAATDLDEAVDRLSEALAAGSPGHPDRADWSALLGVAHGLRYDLTMDPADRDAGIQALVEGLEGRPPDDAELATFQMVLGNLCWERVRAGQGPDPRRDLERVLDHLGAVLRLPDLEPEARLEAGSVLGLAAAVRYQQTGTEQDLDQAIDHLAEVVGPATPGSGPPGLALELGRLLWVRGTTGTRPQDRDAAVERFRLAVEQMAPDDPDRWQALLLCGSACLERGVNAEALRWDGGIEDLNTIVNCFAELLPLLPKPEVPRARVVAALGFARFQRAATGSGQPDDLEASLGLLEEAADSLEDVGEQLANFRTVALSILDGCRRGFHPRGMRLVLKLLTRVADELPEGDPLRVEAAAELGVATVLAFDLGQLPAGLDPAAERLEQLLASPGELAHAGLAHAALGAVLARRSMEGIRPDDVDRAIRHLERGLELLEPGHLERPGTEVNLASALYARFYQRHQASDLDAAEERLRGVKDRLEPGSPQWLAAKGLFGGILFVRANYRQDARLAGEAVEVLQQLQEALPPSSPLRPANDQALGMALLLRSQLQGSPGDRETAVDLLERATEGLPPDAPMARVAKATAGLARAARSDPDNPDVQSLDDGVAWLREAVTSSPRQDLEQAMNMASLGGLLFGRHMARYLEAMDAARAGSAGAVDLALDDLNEAIRWMEAAAELVPDRAATAWWSPMSLQLCMALRRRSVFVPADRRRSREVGLEGLRGFAWRVLLQAGTEDAMAAARDAARQALEIADWCLDDGALDQAVEALESGRGLVLHAATASASIAGRLQDAGHHELAAEWEAALASPAPQPLPTADPGGPDRLSGVPSDLAFRILQALEGAGVATRSRPGTRPGGLGARLLVPPTVGEIRAALGSLGADALVYLVPRSELSDDGGPAARAVVVRSDGEPVRCDLALLETGPGTPLDDYVAALEDRRRAAVDGTDADRRAALGRWRRSLEGLCDWAWTALEPLLRLADGWELGRPARVILVPVGLLGLVPWHAARTPADGGHRYAVQQATFSSAASARLLCEVAARTVLPRDGHGLLVGDPTGTLHHAVQEALALRGAFYPQAAYLGQPGDVAVEKGTPGQVLRRLTGGQPPPVQHLACHAFIEDSPARTHLLLAGMQQLTVGDLLAAARGRQPEAPGATVSLAACTTNLAGRQHDESLTLATAFLVAGAAAVVGSLWQVPDLRTALLMFMTHHYLHEAGATAGEALRRAQLWMLDPGREVPASMPDVLARLVHTTDLTAPHGWAGFTHQGW